MATKSETKAAFITHLSAAIGSLAKLETQIEIVGRVDYIKSDNAERLLPLADQVDSLLDRLLSSLQSKGPGPLGRDKRPPFSNN